MRSELFRIPNELFGIPLFGVGLLLLALVVVTGYMLWNARKSPTAFNELLAQWPMFAIVAAVIVFVPRVFPEGLPIRGYGLMLVLAGVVGLTMATYRARQRGIDGDTIIAVTMWMFIAGIFGARVFFVIEHWETAFADLSLPQSLLEALNFTSGGLVVYGAVLGAGIAFAYFCRRHGIGILPLADILAPSLLAGLALGRIGCLLHGCCFGGPCDLPWAVTFPQWGSEDRQSPPYSDQLIRGEMHGIRLEEFSDGDDRRIEVVRVDESIATALPQLAKGTVVTAINGTPVMSLDDVAPVVSKAYNLNEALTLTLESGEVAEIAAAPQRERSLPIHPTQIYSSINAALMATFLWFVYRVRGRDGVVVGLMLTMYPIARFLLEAIRTDETSFLGTGLSISQNISLALLAAMPIYWWWLLRRPAVPQPK